MECSLYALLACFSWSNFYIDTQISYRDQTVPYLYWREDRLLAVNGVQETIFRSSIEGESESPYLRNALGFKLPFRHVDVQLDLFFHDSSMKSDKDRGVNGAAIRATWFPFR